MADISRITLPSGTTYDIKDATARQMISAGVTFNVCTVAADTPYGVTWTKNGTTITGTLAASTSTMGAFYLVPTTTSGGKDIYAEYITVQVTSDFSWEKIGTTDVDLSSLGDLAYKDTASGNYTPEGTVSQPSFSGTSSTFTGSYMPSGTISQPTFTGSEENVSVTGTPTGSISVGTGSANYTPQGNVGTPVITVTPNTVSKYVATSATAGGVVTAGNAAQCTLPTLQTTVADETLTLSWTAGSFTPNQPTLVTLPTFSSQTIATGIKSATSGAISFNGTGVNLKFTGNSMSSSGKLTPHGSVSTPTFTGTEETITVTGTPAGSVSQPTFTGTQKAITVS